MDGSLMYSTLLFGLLLATLANANDIGMVSSAAERADRLNKLTNVRGKQLRVEVSCELCRNVIQYFIALLKDGVPLATLVDQAVNICVVDGCEQEFNCRYEIEMLAVSKTADI